jgi:hypothetical protein
VTKFLTHVKHNLVAYLALFVALGGTSYAAINLPAGSVGSKQLRSGAVTNKKLAQGAVGAADLDPKSIAGYVRAYVQISAQGQIFASSPRAKVLGAWQTSIPAPDGGTIQWSRPLPADCFALATTEGVNVGTATAIFRGGGKGNALTDVLLSSPAQAVNIAVMCPNH